MRRAFAVAVVLAVFAACSDDEPATATPEANEGDAGPLTVSPAACKGRCEAKAAECNAPSAQAELICAQICNAAVTEGQAQCLEATSCGDLVGVASRGGALASICPLFGDASAGTVGPTEPPAFVPPAVTIAAAIPPGYVATHTTAGTMLSSLFNVAGPPSFSTPLPPGHFPLLQHPRVDATVVSPPRSGCASKINVTIDATTLAVSTSGVDVSPSTTCAAFIDAIAAEGLTLTLEDVPWANTEERSTVTIALRKQ
ncbi:MAG: hypothetical protein KIT84_12080 [Labilithrix sp.]|nr:hypothetical protein [Labilithrix sp.]MCW5811750.1 hypothetical protein [Labilithrix sp.]